MASIVNTEHPAYEKMTDQWVKARACVNGQKAVHNAGKLFLPALKDQTTDDYNAYKLRASFFNATWRTISALSGMLFRKPPEIDVAASVEPYLEDVTMDGRNLQIFAQQVVLEDLTTGRVGILVDYPQGDTTGKTLADIDKENMRPLLAMYKAENIINWKQQRIDNEMRLTLVVLTEDAALEGNEFEHKCETHYRVLDLIDGKQLDNSQSTGFYPVKVYRQRVFRINDKQEDEQVGGDIFPLMNGKPLSTIPFIFIGIDDTTPEMDEPPLIDLVDVNLSHYRMNADLFHGLHFTGLPTAFLTGYTPENPGDKLYIGSPIVNCLPDPQSKAFFLEFTGQGLGAIVTALERAEQQMAILGARLLSSEKKAVETAQTAQIHRAGESSILSSIAQTISIGLTEALGIFSEWAGVDGEASINLNTDFIPVGMEPQQLTALVSAWMSGAISLQTLFENLQQGEIIGQDITYEMEQSRITEGAPPVPKQYEVVNE